MGLLNFFSKSTKISDFRSIKIGNQEWMIENLDVSIFRNGDLIPEARNSDEWEKLGKQRKPAWCYHHNQSKNGREYGKLYNWYAVNDPRYLAPNGWDIPSDADWKQLIDFLGGEDVAGSKLKKNTGWHDGCNGTNESGFSGLPGGYRDSAGGFWSIKTHFYCWLAARSLDWRYETWISQERYYILDCRSPVTYNSSYATCGLSVRCIKDPFYKG